MRDIFQNMITGARAREEQEHLRDNNWDEIINDIILKGIEHDLTAGEDIQIQVGLPGEETWSTFTFRKPIDPKSHIRGAVEGSIVLKVKTYADDTVENKRYTAAYIDDIEFDVDKSFVCVWMGMHEGGILDDTNLDLRNKRVDVKDLVDWDGIRVKIVQEDLSHVEYRF